MHQPNQYRPPRQRLRLAHHGLLVLELLVALTILATIAWYVARYQVVVGATRTLARAQLEALDELVSCGELLLSGESLTLEGATHKKCRACFVDESGIFFDELPVVVTSMEQACAGGSKKVHLTLVLPSKEGQ